MIIAIIGTRDATQEQRDSITKIIESLPTKVTAIISGCADGVDAHALQMGLAYGMITIGIVPWKKYNLHVQKYCKDILSLEDASPEKYKEAIDSVYTYHPSPQRLSRGALMLQARNYLIVHKADKVYAYPKNMSGGTMQGVRIAQGLGIPIELL